MLTEPQLLQQTLPLYQRPGALTFLDDDPSYLESLTMVLPRDWCTRLFTRVDDCVATLQVEHAAWEADIWAHYAMVDQWRAGKPLLPQILKYWSERRDTWGLTKVFVVDYEMPAMTGLDVLKRLGSWPKHRILLTGKADEMVAVTAFNQGLINQFVTKQRSDVATHLTQLLASQEASAMSLYDGVWGPCLSQKQHAHLQSIDIMRWLQAWLQAHDWREYVVLAQPFGILALNAQGQAFWLQLELQDDLSVAAELASSSDHTQEQVECIRSGSHLSNAEMRMAMSAARQTHSNFIDYAILLAPAFEVGAEGSMLGAVFELPFHLPLGQRYDDFRMAQQSLRIVDLS